MDKLVLEKKVESLIKCLKRIDTRTPQTKAEFIKDPDSQDIIVLNLTRAIQLSVDIAMHIIATNNNASTPQTMSESFDTLEQLNIIDKHTATKLKKSVGFRNIAVHNYGELDLALTYKIAHEHIGDFKTYIKQILATEKHEQ